MTTPIPVDIKLLQKQRTLTISFDNGEVYELPCEYLRVFSPSAEVQGHGSTPKKLITGKEQVNIIGIEPVGQYAIKLVFDDGHDTGLYSWDTLYKLAAEYQQNWQRYLQQIKENSSNS